MTQPIPPTNACGCPYTPYLMTASAIGRKYGGPWCPSCGANLGAREAGAQLVREIRHPFERIAVRLDAASWFRAVGAWADRHQVWAAILYMAFIVALCWTVLEVP